LGHQYDIASWFFGLRIEIGSHAVFASIFRGFSALQAVILTGKAKAGVDCLLREIEELGGIRNGLWHGESKIVLKRHEPREIVIPFRRANADRLALLLEQFVDDFFILHSE